VDSITRGTLGLGSIPIARSINLMTQLALRGLPEFHLKLASFGLQLVENPWQLGGSFRKSRYFRKRSSSETRKKIPPP
jgi:hypothetical protein